MGVYIPNMEKPKNCAECFYGLRCKAVPRWITTDDSIPKDCPLIEIVTCGECKWLGVDEGMPFCYWWLREIESDVFCSHAERRTETLDERIKRGLEEWKEK